MICKEDELESILSEDERNWFLNYPIILKKYNNLNAESELEKNIHKFLIPSRVRKKQGEQPNGQNKTYFSFYFLNIKSNIKLIKDIDNVYHEISDYIEEKIKERIENKSQEQEESEEVEEESEILKIDFPNEYPY